METTFGVASPPTIHLNLRNVDMFMTLPNCLQLRQASLCRDRHPYSVVSGCCTNCENMVTTWAAVTSILTMSLSWGRSIIVSQRSCFGWNLYPQQVANLHPADPSQPKWSQKRDRLMKLCNSRCFNYPKRIPDQSLTNPTRNILCFPPTCSLWAQPSIKNAWQPWQPWNRWVRVDLDRWRFANI